LGEPHSEALCKDGSSYSGHGKSIRVDVIERYLLLSPIFAMVAQVGY